MLGAAASAAVLAIVGVFAWLLADLLRHGLGGLSWHFLMAPVEAAGRAGGIAPILVSTLAILAICLAAALPIGLGTAILLAELGDANSRFGRFVRRCLDILAGMPSIVFGLFGNAFFSLVLGLGFSLLAGGLTLACMVLPLFIREAEEGLRAVPQEQRLAAAALGLGRWRMLWLVVLPAAAPGLFVGLVLAVGRALAETAALLFTSGYVDRMPGSLLDSGRALSIHIYDLSMNVPGGEANAYTAALVLVALLLAINSAAAWLAGRLGRARWQVA
ncbi:MAG: phosphate ABC transporter permease PstA [Acidobacteriota bacterium]